MINPGKSKGHPRASKALVIFLLLGATCELKTRVFAALYFKPFYVHHTYPLCG